MISERAQRVKYVLGDYATSNVAWFVFNCVRFHVTNVGFPTLMSFLTSKFVLLGQLVFPLFMMFIYWLSGYYNEVFRKSRMQELFTTVWSVTIITICIFLIALINDVNIVQHHQRGLDYEVIAWLWGLQFVLVYAYRLVVTTDTSTKIKSREWSFPTLIIGRGAAAVAYVNKLIHMPKSLGYRVVGYVSIPDENDVKDVGDVPCYTLDEVKSACEANQVTDLIVVPTRKNNTAILHTVNRLYELGRPIKMLAERSSLALSMTRVGSMLGEPLVDVSSATLSDGATNVKRLFDVVASAIMLVLLAPFTAVMALFIKLDSKGPVFYRQQRVGMHNKPFNIIKFRSMAHDAEPAGSEPRLSSNNDPRITRIGHWMRKYRIDELPQFWNVLVGDMSIVGPRPERPYYVEQILKRSPHYALLHQVRPGITSMGMVKYGYATTVAQMVERMRYDLIYVENMSLLNDVKIMVYTVRTIFTGQGM